jgi:CheY-like chemotaxis protein
MRKPLRILLVDDDDEDALLFRRRCPPEFRVHYVEGPDPALAALRASAFDVCFTDYCLGAETGLGLVRAVRAEGLRIPIVVMTGQDIESLGENALLSGATDFVPKDGLDAATIGRVARWSLIRRHVENRRDDHLGEALVGQLLGRAPIVLVPEAAASASAPQSLRRVLYLSRARRCFAQPELLLLCGGFAAANAACHITGVLVYLGDRFMQVIEGEHTAVEVLLRRIERDPRHGEMAVVVDEPVSRRAFAQWNMGCVQIGERYELSPMQWSGVCEKAQRVLGDSQSPRDGVGRLIHSLPGLLLQSSAAQV